jgi:hypothetical protein
VDFINQTEIDRLKTKHERLIKAMWACEHLGHTELGAYPVTDYLKSAKYFEASRTFAIEAEHIFEMKLNAMRRGNNR